MFEKILIACAIALTLIATGISVMLWEDADEGTPAWRMVFRAAAVIIPLIAYISAAAIIVVSI